MNTWLRDNGLWLTLFAFFVLSEMGRIFSDWRINSTLTAADAAPRQSCNAADAAEPRRRCAMGVRILPEWAKQIGAHGDPNCSDRMPA